jgi:hypothetical protein
MLELPLDFMIWMFFISFIGYSDSSKILGSDACSVIFLVEAFCKVLLSKMIGLSTTLGDVMIEFVF